MVTNLYGEIVHGLDDICKLVNKRSMENGVFKLNYNINSEKQGFWFNPLPYFSTHSTPGFYAIFKNNTLEYIGYSSSSIGCRISRFVKEVNCKSRSDENYPAARKWRRWNGNNFDGCHIMFAEFEKHEVKQYGYSYEAIEKALICEHKPRMNITK
jgi:hypothetical protein